MIIWTALILLMHFAIRQCVTEALARETPRSLGRRYFVGKVSVAIFWVTYLVLFFAALSRLSHTPGDVFFAVGYTVTLMGTVLRFWALIALRGFYFPNTSLLDNHRVIRSGPYSRLRHPLCLGLLIEATGLLLIARSIGLAPVYLVLALEIQRYNISEEEILNAQLGEEYTRYVQQTWDTSAFVSVRLLVRWWDEIHAYAVLCIWFTIGKLGNIRASNSFISKE